MKRKQKGEVVLIIVTLIVTAFTVFGWPGEPTRVQVCACTTANVA